MKAKKVIALVMCAAMVAGYNSAQVSEMVGYHDSNYFSRVFKKYYGISPTQFVDEMNHS